MNFAITSQPASFAAFDVLRSASSILVGAGVFHKAELATPIPFPSRAVEVYNKYIHRYTLV
jgi:hypothetical protein